MFSRDFPSYSHSDGLDSLAIKCIRILCCPVDQIHLRRQNNLSALYDLNRFDADSRSAKSPRRLFECLYKSFRSVGCSFLDIVSRQAIIDYIVREKLRVRAEFLINILQDGGIYNFDLWKLSIQNEFTDLDIEMIFDQMLLCSKSFRQLSLGGRWILHHKITNGSMKKFLCQNESLKNLKVLKLENLPAELDFVSLLISCCNIQRLEIVQPSLKDDDIFKLTSFLSSQTNLISISKTLKYVTLPSSVEERGVLNFLAHFPSITHLKCVPIDQLLSLVDRLTAKNFTPETEMALKARNVLKNLRVLSLPKPIGINLIERLFLHCPNIQQLCLDLCEDIDLSKLATHAPMLQKLELHTNTGNSLTFSQNVVPILEECGKELKFLSLINFNQIDLTKIAQYCPNLQTLNIQSFNTITFQSRFTRLLNIKDPFRNLIHLRLVPRSNHSLPVEICRILLQNSFDLNHLEINCPEMTNEILLEINRTNSLGRLQTFILHHGHNISNEPLWKVISTATVTNHLVYHDCGLLPPDIKENRN